MKRILIVSAAFAFSALAAPNAWACREGTRAFPAEISAENTEVLARADRIFVGRVSSPRRNGGRVIADIVTSRELRGTGRQISFDDESLPSTCSPIASKRLGSLTEGMPILVLEKDGPGGFSILIDEGGLLMLEANDLLALIEPDTGE